MPSQTNRRNMVKGLAAFETVPVAKITVFEFILYYYFNFFKKMLFYKRFIIFVLTTIVQKMFTEATE